MNRDYLRSDTAAARRHLAGVSDSVIDLAREGMNARCVDCGAFTLAGGLRCMACFLSVARPKYQVGYESNPEPGVQYVPLRNVV